MYLDLLFDVQLPASVSESVQVYQSGVVPQEEDLSSRGDTQEEDSTTGSWQGKANALIWVAHEGP
eukprot:1145038-Pelagomonas_calceolata.AAC.6